MSSTVPEPAWSGEQPAGEFDLVLEPSGPDSTTVLLLPRAPDSGQPPHPAARNDALRYAVENRPLRVAGLSRGAYALWAEAPGFASLYLHRALEPDDGPLVRLRLPFRRGVPVRGRVQDAAGKAIAGATVTAFAAQPWAFDAQPVLPPPAQTNSSATGDFETGPLPDGRPHVLVAEAPGFVPSRLPLAAAASAPVLLQLAPEASIRGDVRTSAGGPAAGAVVLVLAGEVAAQAVADASGRIQVQGLPPGVYRIFARRHDELLPLHRLRQRTFHPGDSGDLRLDLQPGGLLRVAVADHDNGRPVPGARVAVAPAWDIDVRMQPVAIAVTDASGEAAVGGLLDGVYTIRVEAEGYAADGMGGAAPEVRVRVVGPAPVKAGVRLRSGRPIAGVVRDARRALPGARVSLLAPGGESAADAAATAETDAQGRFVFKAVAPGRYTLLVQSEGYAPATRPGLRAGTDTGDIVLSSGGVVNGRILGPDGEGMPNACVLVRAQPGGGNGAAQAMQEHTIARADGSFRMTCLPPGVYRAAALAEGLVLERPAVWVVGEGEEIDAGEIVLGRGWSVSGSVRRRADGTGVEGATLVLTSAAGLAQRATTERDGFFRFTCVGQGMHHVAVQDAPAGLALPGDGSLAVQVGERDLAGLAIELPPAGSVRCGVRAPDGHPLEAVLVELASPATGRYAARGMSGADGIVERRDVPYGIPLVAYADVPGFAPATSPPFRVGSASPEVELWLTLRRGGSVGGRVTTKDGRGLETGVRIAPPQGLAQWGRRTVSELDGHYRIDDVGPGLVRVAADGGAERVVDVREGEETSGVDLAVDGIDDATASLEGRVVDAEGRPLAGAEVELSRLELAPAGPSRTWSAAANPDGRFTCGELVPGTYHLRVRRDPTGWWRRHGTVSAPDRDIEIVLPRGGGLDGTVVDHETERPVRPFRLAVRGASQPAVVVDNASGAFSLRELPPGRKTLVVEAEGYAPALSGPHDVVAGTDTAGLAIRLRRGGTIRGRVEDGRTGEPVARAAVEALGRIGLERRGWDSDPLSPEWGETAAAEADAFTDDDGRFTLQHVPAGPVRLRITHPAYAVGLSDSVAVEEGATIDPVVIRLSIGCAIEGTVFGADGRERTGAEVTCRQIGGGTVRRQDQGLVALRTVTDAEGGFRFDPIPAGRYLVQARVEGGVASRRSVNVEEGTVLRLNIGVGTLTVRGTVRRGGDAVRGALVALSERPDSRSTRWSAEAITGEDGSYLITGVTPPEEGAVFLQVYGGDPTFWSAPLVSRAIDLDRDEVTVDVELPSRAIAGRVLDGLGRPLPRAFVQLFAADGTARRERPLQHAFADTGGGFAFGALPAEVFRVVAELEDYRTAEASVDLAAEATPDALELRLVALSGQIAGRVTASDGGALSAGAVEIAPASASPAQTGRRVPIANGGFTASRLVPGAYDLLVTDRGSKDFAVIRGLAVDAGTPAECRVRLLPGKEIVFEAARKDGAVVEEARIEIFDTAGRPHPLRVDGPGTVRAVVHNTTYRVVVRVGGAVRLDVQYETSGFGDGQRERLVLE